MSPQHLDLTNRTNCSRCGQQVTASVLSSIQPAPKSGAVACKTCLAMDSWKKIVATVLAHEEAASSC